MSKSYDNVDALRALAGPRVQYVSARKSLQTCIDDAYNTGGGTVVIATTTTISSTATLRRNVNLWFLNNAAIAWNGAVGGTVVQTDQSDVVQNCEWQNLFIDTGAGFTGTALAIHSAHNINANVIRLKTTGLTSKAMTIYADSTGGDSELTKRNVTAVYIGQIKHEGQCGTLLETGGLNANASPYQVANGPSVVTLNTVGQIFGENCAQYGINFKQWTDNNSFPGMNRVILNGNNAVGLQVGGTSATENLGVYTNSFGTVAIDTFGTYVGRKGVVLSRSKLTTIQSLYNNPLAEGGAFEDDAFAESYYVTYQEDSTARMVQYRREFSHIEGATGFNSSQPLLLADDTATSILLADSSSVNENITFTATFSTNDANSSGDAWFKVRKSSGSPAATELSGASAFNVITGGGVLSGTTGPDGNLNVSPGADGRLYVENRLGFAVVVVVTVRGWTQQP